MPQFFHHFPDPKGFKGMQSEPSASNCGLEFFGFGQPDGRKIDWAWLAGELYRGGFRKYPRHIVVFSGNNTQTGPQELCAFLRSQGEKVVRTKEVQNGPHTIRAYFWFPSDKINGQLNVEFEKLEKARPIVPQFTYLPISAGQNAPAQPPAQAPYGDQPWFSNPLRF